MKLALIRRQFSPTGGAELYMQRLLEALAEAGHELHLFAEAWAQTPPGVSLHHVDARGSRAERPLRFAESVERAVAQGRWDCVFSLERTLRQDVYRAGDGVHRVWLLRRRQFAPWWRKLWTGWGAFHKNMLRLEAQTFDPGNTRFIIANSEMVRREILENFRFPADRILLVRNGVEVARLQKGDRAATRARFGVQDNEFLLLFAGSGWERKGLAFVLQALRAWPSGSVKLLVAGKGIRPRGAPPNAIFAGVLTEMHHAYAAADLLVFVPIYEPSANVCYEALAAGLPVVTSAYNGAAEIIQEKVNGSVIGNPADTSALVEAINYWKERRPRPPVPTTLDLSLGRNVQETVAALEMAARK
ncbi:MAG: glycosyltransferase family 4 protein [Chloroflexi bacterium]|nr:glycosyltransferase family 4 protein [Chloroflexota bacterium]